MKEKATEQEASIRITFPKKTLAGLVAAATAYSGWNGTQVSTIKTELEKANQRIERIEAKIRIIVPDQVNK